MNELSKLITETPLAAIAGAVVFIALKVNSLEKRIEDIASHHGLPPRKKKRSVLVGVIVAASVVMLCGCTFSRKCTKNGTCTTSIGMATNSVPILRELRKVRYP